MERVLVIGSGGAGKSTFARSLGAATGLPVVHLDANFWRPGWDPTPAVEWAERVSVLLQPRRWIMDGNFGGTLELRLAACDTVVLLDMPRIICLRRALRRWWQYRQESRPDMTPGCAERIDFGFLRWIWRYPTASLPKVLDKLSRLPAGVHVVRLQSPQEVDEFLDNARRARSANPDQSDPR